MYQFKINLSYLLLSVLGMLHSFIGFLFDVITCQFQLKKKDEKVSFSSITVCCLMDVKVS